MNRYGVPSVFRTRRQKWEDRPCQDRQWLIHAHGSAATSDVLDEVQERMP